MSPKQRGAARQAATWTYQQGATKHKACEWCYQPAIPESHNGDYCTEHKLGPKTPGLRHP